VTVQAISPQMRANFRNLYLDVFWYGVLAGSTLAFINIYTTRLGASVFEISLLTAGPAAVNLLFSLPAGQWLQGRALIPTTFWSAVLQRIGFLCLVPLPFLFNGNLQIWAIVLLTLLVSIPATILAISFNALFAEVVPPEWRAEVVGKRNALMAISLMAATLLSGRLLDQLVFPLNYALVFLIGALGAALSTYFLGKLRSPDLRPVQPAKAAAHTNRPRNQLRPADLLRTTFGSFMLVYLLFYTFQFLGIPLFPLVQVRVLNLSDGMISLGSTLFYGVMLLVSLRIVDISTRLGHKRTLAIGATSFGIYPLLLGLAHGPALFWAASFFGGGAWGVTNAGLTNRLMEKVPDDRRPAGMALHNLVLNLGILLGSLAALPLSNWAGLQPAMFIVAALRFLAGGLFWLWG
jgi:MFS family permease